MRTSILGRIKALEDASKPLLNYLILIFFKWIGVYTMTIQPVYTGKYTDSNSVLALFEDISDEPSMQFVNCCD